MTTLRSMTAAGVGLYGDGVKSRGKSVSYVRRRFGAIKATINHARKRGDHSDDCRHALDCCAVLVNPKRPP